MSSVATPACSTVRRVITIPARGVTRIVVILCCVIGGFGWLYGLRQLRWFDAGPRISDALPLLQLPGFDRQPLLRVVVAWGLSGVFLGIALCTIDRVRRAILAGTLGLMLLLLASQAAHSIARNVQFGHTIVNHVPGLGPWLEAGLMALASCAFPRRVARGKRGSGSERADGINP
jgi:hypothetical protein